MFFKLTLFCVFLTSFTVSSADPYSEHRKKDEFIFSQYGQCVMFTYASDGPTQSELERCMHDSKAIIYLPVMNIVKFENLGSMNEAKQQCASAFVQKMVDEDHKTSFDWTSGDFSDEKICAFFEKQLLPTVCEVEPKCGPNEFQQQLAHTMSWLYAERQVFNDQVDTPLICGKTQINFNPELYKTDVEYTPDLQYLKEPIDCDNYRAEQTLVKEEEAEIYVPREERKGYVTRVWPGEYEKYQECLALKSIVDNEPKDAEECMYGSRFQAQLPAFYIEQVWVKDERLDQKCVDRHMEKLEKYDRYGHELWSDPEKDYLTEEELCSLIEDELIPRACKVEDVCSWSEVQARIGGSVAYAYSLCQFAHGGMNVQFNCTKSNYRINPALYKLGTQYRTNFPYLTDFVDCDLYKSDETTRFTTIPITTVTPFPEPQDFTP